LKISREIGFVGEASRDLDYSRHAAAVFAREIAVEDRQCHGVDDPTNLNTRVIADWR
jgi:hypothetical protein